MISFVDSGSMVYQYIHDDMKPHIKPCRNANCWVRRRIIERFGPWAPTSPDAALYSGGRLHLIKNNVVYQAVTGPTPLHNIFPMIARNVDAVAEYCKSVNFIMTQKKLLLHGNLYKYFNFFGYICMQKS